MKRNTPFKSLRHDQLLEHSHYIAFHEAGHAAAIYLNNKIRNLAPVSFQIIIKDLQSTSEESILVYQVAQNDNRAKEDHITAFEVDIINLLIGPLAEAKYIADTDDELFSHKLVNLKALKNYGGSSDLDSVDEYLNYFSTCKQQQAKKLDELFAVAVNFINDRTNWAAITKLAHYILNSNKNIINCEDVAYLLEH
ncbi:MAG: hypothetical protein Q8Q50_10235 [Methylobacter sp.]|nr:hypothetical protein [Methylobacter sp.]